MDHVQKSFIRRNIFILVSIILNLVFITSTPIFISFYNNEIERLNNVEPIIITEVVEKIVKVEVPVMVTSTLVDPLDNYVITSNSGVRQDPMGGGDNTFHRGIDMVPLLRTENRIRSIESGIVEVHYPPPNGYFEGHPIYGALIIIRHDNGLYSLYTHMSETYIRVGQRVKRGQFIGRVGNTGMATGPHLHFEIFFNPDSIVEEILKYDEVEQAQRFLKKFGRNIIQ